MSGNSHKRIVVKCGTSTLTHGTEHLSMPSMVSLVQQIDELHKQGVRVILVSSGAIAAGREVLRFPTLPRDVPVKQMLSAIGQPQLMSRWSQLFSYYGITVSQVLLTKSDLRDRRRYLNARNTLQALFDQHVIPIVNENDTVATEEIRVGDNDNLASLVANLVDADLLLMLTDIEGVYTTDPRHDDTARLIPVIDEPQIPDSVWAAAGHGGKLGVGGMYTKLQAADLARRSGTAVVITDGRIPNVVNRVAAGEPLGTRFEPTLAAVESRKRYIISGCCGGDLTVDTGAARALHNKRSLLPVGLARISGEFERGDSVRILGPDNQEIARGVVNYNATDCARLVGLHSDAIEGTLGYFYGETLVHKDNLVITT